VNTAGIVDMLVRKAEAWGRRHPKMRQEGAFLAQRVIEARNEARATNEWVKSLPVPSDQPGGTEPAKPYCPRGTALQGLRRNPRQEFGG
jgi:hypothetical protein